MTHLTEKEARERWCPFARVVVGTQNGGPLLPDCPTGPQKMVIGNVAANRAHEGSSLPNEFACNCIASGCMAWRWGDVVRTERRISRDGDEFETYMAARLNKEQSLRDRFFEYDGYRWRYMCSDFDEEGEFDMIARPNLNQPKVGYCGLVGRAR